MNEARQILNRSRYLSRSWEFRFSDLIFGLWWHVCVEFGRHIKEYKENDCKRWPIPYSLWKKLLRLCAVGFCNQVLLDFHCWWNEELCSQQSSSSWWLSRVLGSAQLVSHVLGFVYQRVAFIYWRVQRFLSGRRFLL